MGHVRTVQRGGSRFYVQDTAPDIRVPGVTSVVGMLPKPFLQYWAAKMTAELAVDSFDFVSRMAERDRQGAVDYLKGASRRYTAIRAEVGSNAHDLFERLMRGEYVGRVHPDLEPYRAHFVEFMRVVNPELVRAEDVAWSDRFQYAGSFDAILRVWIGEDGKPTPDRSGEPHLLIVDWKTSKDTYPDVSLQMAAYANADRIISPDGTSEPMPTFDGAAVLHVTPDQWAFKPVRIDPDVFEVFLTLRKVFTWDRETSKTVIGRAIAKSVGRIVTGTQRRSK
jgi:plasmid stabilization system protein ParE